MSRSNFRGSARTITRGLTKAYLIEIVIRFLKLHIRMLRVRLITPSKVGGLNKSISGSWRHLVFMEKTGRRLRSMSVLAQEHK